MQIINILEYTNIDTNIQTLNQNKGLKRPSW